MQFFHPFEVKGYQKAARALRTIGRNCIQKRIKALDNGEEVPRDILSYILKVASKCGVSKVFVFICLPRSE